MNERNNNFSAQIDGGKLKFIEVHHYFLSLYCSNLTTSRSEEKHDKKRHLLFSVALSSYDRMTKFEPNTILKLKKYVIYALFYIFHFFKSHSTFSYLTERKVHIGVSGLYFWRSVLWSCNENKRYFVTKIVLTYCEKKLF